MERKTKVRIISLGMLGCMLLTTAAGIIGSTTGAKSVTPIVENVSEKHEHVHTCQKKDELKNSNIGSTTDQNNHEIESVSYEQLKSQTGSESVDFDLTKLSNSGAYDACYNITINPDQYLGHTVKASGTVSKTETDEKVLTTLLIKNDSGDVQGFEFELAEGEQIPDDGSEITITGSFETYVDNDYTYLHIEKANIVE